MVVFYKITVSFKFLECKPLLYLRKGSSRYVNVSRRIVLNKGEGQLRILHMREYIHGESEVPVGKVIGEDHIAACAKEPVQLIHRGGQTQIGAIV